MKITEDFIIQFTGNASAVANGRKLAAKGSYSDLSTSGDESLIFGSCAGSGKNPYQCSVDFTDEASPVPRCSCPSRQIPCKHAVGLLFCRLNGAVFTTREIPEEVKAKREKIQKRKEKSNEAIVEKPRTFTKAKAAAAIKKCRAQLEGLALAEKILHNIVLSGLHSMDAGQQKQLMVQVKELGNYYIGGVQAEFTELLAAAREGQTQQSFTGAVERVNKCYALLKKGKTYLECKIADYEAFPEMTATAEKDMLHSAIEEQLGYAWKLSELKEKGLYREQTELLQVAFNCYEETGRRQWVDEGIWFSLADGEIYKTYNYRPFRAARYIREEDSCFQITAVSELHIYPGDKNPRVRWDKSTLRDTGSADFQQILTFGEHDFAAVIKQVKGQIRSPLNDKHPIFLLHPAEYRESGQGQMVIVDQAGVSVPLRLELFGDLLKRISRQQVEGGALVCRFAQDPEDEVLYAVPLAAVSADGMVRFYY